MFLFIFESIGTSELILIGVLALIFLGPRKMPEYARKLGKLMNEFRSTTNEFKATWEREVNFDEETNAFLSEDVPAPVPRIESAPVLNTLPEPVPPQVAPADPALFTSDGEDPAEPKTQIDGSSVEDDVNDRKNWL